jgi:hypothetical protein
VYAYYKHEDEGASTRMADRLREIVETAAEVRTASTTVPESDGPDATPEAGPSATESEAS